MFTNPVTAEAANLVKQSGITTNTYLRYALETIDAELGEGQARKNPALVAEFMRCCAIDFQTAVISQTLQEGAAAIVAAIESRGT